MVKLWRLMPKASILWLYLVGTQWKKVIEKDELMTAIWPRYDCRGKNNLTQNILDSAAAW